MKGNIYSDQKCPICGGRFHHDERKGGLFCAAHLNQRASGRFRVAFGRGVIRRAKTYEEAVRFLNGMRYEEDRGTFDPQDYASGQPLAMCNALNAWLEEKSYEIQKGTLKSYRPAIRRFSEFFQYTNIKLIRLPGLKKYVLWAKQQGLSEKTIFNDINCLRHFYRTQVSGKIISSDDLPEFPKISYEMKMRKIVTIDTQDLILKKVKELTYDLNPRIWIGIKILCRYPSLRPGGLLGLDEKDVDYEQGKIIIERSKTRRHGVQTVVLFDDDLDLLRSLPTRFQNSPVFRHEGGVQGTIPGQRFGKRYFYIKWKEACSDLGIEGVDLYGGTKHSTATAIADNSSPEQAMRVTGHTTNKAFKRYISTERNKQLDILSLREGEVKPGPKSVKQVSNINEARNRRK
ncbi:Phage integrase, N-terminal SAM-like domain [Geoalkalibacter ferrihydriticus]|uniref:Phage integrase, N-terminal SAM-like domain n=1 Tax=Geoalkalibacter ferrihydriticus TaxID=392333 RepID=A0A1G9KWN9_9BACT|nr:phage integrase SAM-like domain-containing protein [Geoalkalibacter ferrihydriticus]SDL54121.1 Phage integrase, N-terminal SAM-like domain [Geoalkalibacter ferrihydriticus]